MNEKKMLQMLENIDEKFIEEANPSKPKKIMFPVNWIVAACICLVMGGFAFSLYSNMQEMQADVVPELLGYKDYYVKEEEMWPHFYNWKYYTLINGEEVCIAQIYGYDDPAPDVIMKDIDNDGVNELICSCMAGTGKTNLYVYHNNNGVIERGYLSYEHLWNDKTIFNLSPGMVLQVDRETYKPQNNTIELEYRTEEGLDIAIIKGWDLLVYTPFIEDEW